MFKEDLRIQQMEEKTERLEQKKVGKLTGKNMLCSEMMRSQTFDKGRRRKAEALSDNIDILKQHHKRWKDLDGHEKNRYAEQAQQEKDRREVMQEMELDQVREQLEFCKRRRLAQTEQRTFPNTLSSFRFTSDELEKVADYFYDPEVCRGQEAREDWELLVKAPKEPSQDVKEAVIAQEMEMRGEEVDPPPLWQRLMCQHRNLFAETVIVFADEPDIGYYFLLGKQTAQRTTVFLMGERMPLRLPAFEAMAPGDDVDIDFSVKFDCSNAVYKTGKEMRNAGGWEIFLYHHAMLDEDIFTCRHEPEKFENVCLLLPFMDLEPPRPVGGGGGRGVSRDWFAKLQEEFPWLTIEDFPIAGAVEGASRTGRHARAPEVRRAIGADLAETDAVEIRRRLMLKRKLWARDVPDVFLHLHQRRGLDKRIQRRRGRLCFCLCTCIGACMV